MLKIDYKKVFISMTFLIERLNQKSKNNEMVLTAYKLYIQNYIEDNTELEEIWIRVLRENLPQEEMDKLYIPNKSFHNIISKF